MDQHQQQQHAILPQQRETPPAPQLIPRELEECMEDLAGNEARAAMKAVRVVMELLSNRNTPSCRERAIAAGECARSAARSAKDAADKCPTPTSIMVAAWAEEQAQLAEYGISKF